MKDYLPIDIFRITLVPELNQGQLSETRPLYGAAISGSDEYYCFSERINNLGLELAVKSKRRNQIIALNNLTEIEPSFEFRFVEPQLVTIKHEPLFPEEIDAFLSTTFYELGHWYKECLNVWEELKEAQAELVELKQSGRKQLTEELPDDYSWLE